MSKSILADQQEFERTEAMARVFMKADRVLSGSKVDIELKDERGNTAPSWTDGRTITFNKSRIGSITSVEDIIRLSGLNYHELAHVLYTPRWNTDIVKAVRSEGNFEAFNLLEDQRIETFLTSVYPSTIPYLVSTFMHFCADKPESWERNFVLVHGRRYIPAQVRREFRDRFVRQDLISQFETIIDEYRKLVYPASSARGQVLIREFALLLSQIGGSPSDPHGHVGGCRPDIDSGRAVPQKDQTDASDASDDLDEELEEDEKEDDTSSTDGTDGSDGTDGPDDSDEGDSGSGSAEGDSESGDGDSSGESSSSSGKSSGKPSAGGEGSGGSGIGSSDGDFKELLEEIAKSVEESSAVQDDVRSKQRSIVNNDGDVSASATGARHREELASPNDISVSRRFSTILEQLRVDSDPGWERRTASGRINVQRVISGAPSDEIWDRWQDGNNDSSDIECVIAIDVSGSMTYQIDGASRAMWVIKRSLESLNANVTVISFGSDTHLVYDKSERANKTKYKRLAANGGTEPRNAVRQSVRILEASKRANKIFIAITDGQWSAEGRGPNTSEGMIEALGKRGVTTALAFIGPDAYMESHKCQVAVAVNDSVELIGFAKQIVSQTMTTKNRGR